MDRHEPDSRLDQPPGDQCRLPEQVTAVAIARPRLAPGGCPARGGVASDVASASARSAESSNPATRTVAVE